MYNFYTTQLSKYKYYLEIYKDYIYDNEKYWLLLIY